MSFVLTSPAFQAGGAIPAEYTGDDADRSPPLSWSGTPPGTKSFALISDDPDAPDPKAPKRTWVHWVVYDIPANATSLVAGASSHGLPTGSREGQNDFGRKRYGGPAPPVGRHRYFFKLYALDASLGELRDATKASVLRAMDGHVLGQAELMGTYERRGARR